MQTEGDVLADMTLAESAAWLTRLQVSGRSPEIEAAFKAWLATPTHAAAFARITDTWEILPGAAALASPPARPRSRAAPAMAAAAVVAIAAIGLLWGLMTRDPVYRTAVGQQQVVTLQDGSRVALNTDTEISVDYSLSRRRVVVRRGEAMFEVAKNPRRPFVAEAGLEHVRALGTVFLVRQDAAATAVTLVEGRVEVTQHEAGGAKKQIAVLEPGQRLSVRPGAVVIDYPKTDAVMAWRRGLVMFDDATLVEATAEINRYTRNPVLVADPGIADLGVSGVFSTADTAGFAKAVAVLHHLKIQRSGDAVLLVR